MRIHTSLDVTEMYALTRGLPISYRGGLTEHGSRTRARAFDVRLEGSGGRNNTGLYGAGDYDGAIWDEWGAFFGRLYLADPAAVCGGTAKSPVYANSEHFTWTTGGRFVTGEIPADSHKRHSWQHSGTAAAGSYSVSECKRCTAVSRQLPYGVSVADSSVFA